MESIKELSRIVQKPKYREVGNWMVRNILRDAAVPVTWALLHTPATANQVTAVSLVIGAIGAFMLSIPGTGWFVAGAVFIQLWYFLDHVDGQIARYRKTACLSGRFFDFVTHHFIHGIVFFCLGVYAHAVSGNFVFIWAGFLASVAMMMFNLISDTKYKTYFEKILLMGSVRIAAGSAAGEEATGKTEHGKSGMKKVFSLMHKSAEIHVLMNVLTGAALLQALLKAGWDLRFPLFLAYAVIAPVIAAAKTAYLIKNRKIDQEFEATFR